MKEVRDVEGHEVLAGLSLFFLSSFHSSFSCFLGIVGGQVCFWVVKTEKGKRKMTQKNYRLIGEHRPPFLFGRRSRAYL